MLQRLQVKLTEVMTRQEGNKTVPDYCSAQTLRSSEEAWSSSRGICQDFSPRENSQGVRSIGKCSKAATQNGEPFYVAGENRTSKGYKLKEYDLTQFKEKYLIYNIHKAKFSVAEGCDTESLVLLKKSLATKVTTAGLL